MNDTNPIPQGLPHDLPRTLVIGASGATGRMVTAELLARGHRVTAFVRRPEAMAELSDRVELAVGDVMNHTDVDRAVAGHDAVVVVLGIRENPLLVRLRGTSGTPIDVRSAGTRNVIEAMRRHGVPRLVVQTTYGVAETHDQLSWFWRMMFDLILKPQIEDTEVQEDLVRQSGLEWVLVRPVSLGDGPALPALVSTTGETRGMNVPRASVADVLADATRRPDYVHQPLAVSA